MTQSNIKNYCRGNISFLVPLFILPRRPLLKNAKNNFSKTIWIQYFSLIWKIFGGKFEFEFEVFFYSWSFLSNKQRCQNFCLLNFFSTTSKWLKKNFVDLDVRWETIEAGNASIFQFLFPVIIVIIIDD